jgi:hypothetical protein
MRKRRMPWKKNLAAVLALFAAGKGWCADNSTVDDPLLDLFIKKGYVSQQEADQVKAELESANTNNNNMPAYQPTPKWSLIPGIKNMELYGDIRMRYEYRYAEDPKGGAIELNRFRYAIRLGLRGDAFDNFYYGLRLETSANPRSPWVTLASSSTTGNSGSSPYQGPFGKSQAGISLGQIYLGWNWQDYVNLTIGAMPNFLYTTPMVWDNDLNPVGAFERFKYTIGQMDTFANFGQFLYEDTNPTSSAQGFFNPLTQNTGELPFLLAWQGGFNYHFTPTANFKIAPVLYQYMNVQNEGTPLTGGVGPDFYGTFVGQGTGSGVNGVPAAYNLAGSTPGFDGFYSNQTGINDLLVLDVPFEFDVKVDGLNVRAFGDYAYNFDGAARANAAFKAQNAPYFIDEGAGHSLVTQIPSPQTQDVHAYQFGIGVGSRDLDYGPEQGLVYGTSSIKHGWELRTYWQHVEQYALDPNLIDSDFLEGIYVAFSYALSDNFLMTARYGNANRINSKLGTAGSNQDIPQMNPINRYRILQLDATLRF